MASVTHEVSVTQPHRVFTATLNDVLVGRVLANAQETTWRYFLVHKGEEPFASAEVAGNEIANVNEGPFVQGTAVAMIAAEQLDAPRHRDYELRLLRIPALYTVAVWLTAEGDDLLIPADPAPEPLVANQPYTEASFVEALRPLAEVRSGGDEMSA
jgi:hypothetical protein